MIPLKANDYDTSLDPCLQGIQQECLADMIMGVYRGHPHAEPSFRIHGSLSIQKQDATANTALQDSLQHRAISKLSWVSLWV